LKRKLLCFGLLAMLTVSPAFTQEDWNKYKRRTLKEITTTLAAASVKDPDVRTTDGKGGWISLSRDTLPSQVKVVYIGSSRKVSVQRKEVIAAWLKTFGKPPEYVDLFEVEYLFAEGSVEYWLRVQKQVASYFEKELEKSGKVNLYVVWVGARKERGRVDHIFLVNEFDKE
jgi:hypothetical protein